MSIGLMMLISRSDSLCHKALDSLKRLNYDTFYVMLDPKLRNSQIEKRLKALNARIYLQRGIYDPEHYAFGRFELLDLIKEDWIASFDDDDEILYDYSKVIEGAGEKIGLIYGNDYQKTTDGNTKFRRASSIRRAEEITKVFTGYWVVRKEAWESVSHRIERYWWWSDFRLFYHLFKAGWKALWIDEPVSVTTWNPAHYKGSRHKSWQETLKTLEFRY